MYKTSFINNKKRKLFRTFLHIEHILVLVIDFKPHMLIHVYRMLVAFVDRQLVSAVPQRILYQTRRIPASLKPVGDLKGDYHIALATDIADHLTGLLVDIELSERTIITPGMAEHVVFRLITVDVFLCVRQYPVRVFSYTCAHTIFI